MKINKSYYALKDEFGEIFTLDGGFLLAETVEELNYEMSYTDDKYLKDLKITKIKIIEEK